jgi:hypothetical protein
VGFALARAYRDATLGPAVTAAAVAAAEACSASPRERAASPQEVDLGPAGQRSPAMPVEHRAVYSRA